MALDWSKEISFSGLRKRTPRAKAEYPSKTYINLVPQNKKTMELNRVVPLALVLVLAVGLFCKFGVFDFYDRVSQKGAELSRQTQVLNTMKTQLTEYDAVKAEYDTYESTKLVSDDMAVSVLDAMALVDKYVGSAADVAAIDVKENAVSLTLANITLDGVGKLTSRLYQDPAVANVAVSTAAEQSGAKTTTATMVITLQKAA